MTFLKRLTSSKTTKILIFLCFSLVDKANDKAGISPEDEFNKIFRVVDFTVSDYTPDGTLPENETSANTLMREIEKEISTALLSGQAAFQGTDILFSINSDLVRSDSLHMDFDDFVSLSDEYKATVLSFFKQQIRKAINWTSPKIPDCNLV